VNAPRLNATLMLICLLLAGCGDQSAGNGNSNDAVIKQAQVLEKRANDQVNETIATIDADSKDAMAKTVSTAEKMETNAVEHSNQN
jgi:uncharacterized protein YcfL